MKRLASIALILALALAAAAEDKKAAPDTSYALGMLLGAEIKGFGLALNQDEIIAGLKDALGGGKTRIAPDKAQAIVQAAVQAAQGKKGAESLAAGKAFLEANRAKPGIKATASGLQYQVLKLGAGPKPAAADTVTVHYEGKLIGGKVFDSSVARGKPATFRLNAVIKGWTEGLQLMPAGSKFRFFIPSELGYGERGAGADIGPNEVLVFEVELLSIEAVKK
jgi:FKBP-type peptidyl-prolyl cis-trans isomerase FklB